MRISTIVFLTLVLNLAVIGQGSRSSAAAAVIKADLDANVCENDKRLEAVQKLFAAKGATEADTKLDKYEDAENFVVTKKGKTGETVIVGAHYDKVPAGCGVIDNWSGIVILANLYSVFRTMDTDKTFVFVAFGKKEKDLAGSNNMARSIAKEEREKYCAVVNFDGFGFSAPQILSNASSSKLSSFTKDLAGELKMPIGQASLAGLADSDSSSFIQKGIPGITLHGLSNRWSDYVHTSRDQLKPVDVPSVAIAYNFGGILLTRLDKQSCGAFQK